MDIDVQGYRAPGTEMRRHWYTGTEIQVHRDTITHGYRRTRIQSSWDRDAQTLVYRYRDTGTQRYNNTWI